MISAFGLWAGFIAFLLAILIFDLGILNRKKHEIGVNEALCRSAGYFLLAMLFCAGLTYYRGGEAGLQFLTGYLIEWSLSVDNIFVFVLIFTHLGVPPLYQHRVLFWGIVGALILRGLMITGGAALIQQFHWIVFIFGALLILTSIKMLMTVNKEPDLENNRVITLARKHLRMTEDFRGDRFFVRENGLLYATPLFLALLLVELTDVIFALDSIPAIFAVTTDAFIVFTANAFAILGLRSLYFALAGIVHRFHYLKYGLSLVLAIVGTKIILNGVFGEKVIPTEFALVVTATIIFGSVLLSWFKTRGSPAPANVAERRNEARGWIPFGGRRSADDARD